MDIKGDWKKRAVSGLMVLAMALSLLPTSILAADTRSVTDNAIKNGSFEQPAFDDRPSPQWVPGPTFDWKTTAFHQKIEFGSSRNGHDAPQLTGNNKDIPDGYQFAELNADEESTLYQYATTVGGNVYEWGLSHRGRYDIDQMAVIIGPKQNVDPAKPSKDGKDQFMQMTDWVKNNAVQMGVSIPDIGCSQKITVYSKPFAKNGGFANNADNVPFSKSPSNVYTEEWNVWIIGTSNTAWGNYGTKSPDYAEGKLAYSCRYAVPDGQTKTVFAFCSYSSATSNKTLGNLIDNIHFSLYQTITAAATAGGSGFIIVPTGDKGSEYYEIGSSMRELVVANGSPITVKVVKPKSDDVQFVGAYVTRQTQTGLEKEFIPAASWSWNEDDRTYTYEHPVEEPADIVLVFVKKPMVIYEANGGQKYVHTEGAAEPTDTVSFATGQTEYTSHAAQAPAGCENTWQFQGWLLARNRVLLPAVHTVTYDKGTNTLTFSGNGTNISTGEAVSSTMVTGGATLVAQWKWRQRFITQVQNGSSFVDDRGCGQVTVDGSSANGNDIATDYYADTGERVSATARANDGYCFIGWYQQIDNGTYQLVSTEATHRYTVEREGVQTVYARFARTHTVTYLWDTSACPDPNMELPEKGTVIDGGTYPISQMYVAKQTTVQGTGSVDGNSNVPGEWVFSGWRDGKDSDVIRLTELINVTTDRVLYGRWTFVPNVQYELRYQSAGENCWTPSGLAQPPQVEMHYRAEGVTAAQSPAYTDGSLFVNDSETLKGTWHFDGWKRSDTTSGTVAAGGEFTMPSSNLTLTGQWTFTPKTYTVVYDLNGGGGTAPKGHTSYDYSALEKKSGCDTTQSGIPFGVSITLQALPDDVQVPKGTYFAGWGLSTNAQQTQQPGDSVNEETLGVSQNGQQVKLYAIYKPLAEITVEFTVNNPSWGTVTKHSGTFYVNQGQTGITGDAVTSQAEAAAGFHFTGWVKENGESAGTNADLMVSAADLNVGQEGSIVRYIAQFAPNAFTVQFNANGGSGEMENQTFRTPQRDEETARYLNKNAFTRKGYSFAGWAEYENGAMAYRDGALFEGVVTYQGQPIKNEATITLYALWEPLPNVTVTYTAYPQQLGEVALNSEDTAVQAAGVSESTNPETGTLLGATATPHAGSVFDGWYNAANQKVSEELRFVPWQVNGRYERARYIAWFHAERYTLHYNVNGGTGTMEDQTFSHGDAQALTECAFARDGYSFVGWAKNAAAQQADYSDQASLFFEKAFPEGTKEATLYAVWKENTVTLSYVSADETLGTVSLASEDILAASGEKARGSTAQPKSGCTFDGWYSENGTLLSRELTYVPVKDGSVWHSSTYTARFSRIPVTPAKPTEPKQDTVTLAPIPQILNGDDHYAYLVGYEDGTVRPNGSISRAEVATVLFRLLKDDVRMQNLTKDNAYSDVSDTAWYAAAVSTLSKMGVISGYPDGTFRPNAPITRAEFAAMIARFDETAKSADTPFTDISGHWAENAIGKAYGNGWVEGSSKTVFCPESNLTRAETATLLNRVLHRLPEKESDLLANQIAWPDNPETFWGYLAIQEATNSHEYERKADGVHETQTAKRENRDWSKEFEQ